MRRDDNPLTAAYPFRRFGSGAAMNWNTFDLNLLVVFDSVMQHKNLTRAGRQLGLSQSAVSHALARLRHMLDDELLVRTSGGMRPTPRAERIGGAIHDALQEMRITLETDEFDAAHASRRFIIAANNYAARAIVPNLVHQVAKWAPAVLLEVRPVGMAPILDQLDRGAVDLGLSAMIDGSDRFKCTGLLDDDYAVILPTELADTKGTELPLEFLARQPHLIVTSSGDNTDFVDQALAPQGLSRRIIAEVPLHSLASTLIGAGAMAVLPRRVCADMAAFRPLVTRSLPFLSPRVSLCMIWHRRLDHDPAQRWLRAMLRASALQA